MTRAGHNSMVILTWLLNQRRLRIHDVLGRLKQPSVAILVPLGATLGAPGRPGEPLWTLWGGTLGALARPGDSFWQSLARGRKKSTKREPNSRSPGRILWGAFWHILLKIDVFLSDVFQIGFFIDFGALRDPPGPQKTSKTIVVLYENKVSKKSKKRAPELHFGSILDLFWRPVADFSDFFLDFWSEQKNSEKKTHPGAPGQILAGP